MTNLTNWKEVQFPKISEWNEVFFYERNYEVYFPKVKIKKSEQKLFYKVIHEKEED